MKKTKNSAHCSLPQLNPKSRPMARMKRPVHAKALLDEMLVKFNVERHGGEVMQWPPVGREIQESPGALFSVARVGSKPIEG